MDKAYPRVTGGYAFEIGSPAAASILVRGRVDASTVHVITACAKDSQDITLQDRQNIAAVIAGRCEKHILVTHGTDSMVDTAEYLAAREELRDRRIVVTGARLPEAMKDSDADFNLGVAVGALQCSQAAGVYVAMNGRVLASEQVTRDMTTGSFVPK